MLCSCHPEHFQEYFGIIEISVAVYSVNHCFPLETLLLGYHMIVAPYISVINYSLFLSFMATPSSYYLLIPAIHQDFCGLFVFLYFLCPYSYLVPWFQILPHCGLNNVCVEVQLFSSGFILHFHQTT